MTTFFAEFPTEFPVERLGWVLVHSLWQLLAIALLVQLARAVTARRGASVRYAAGLCGLAAMTAAPVVTWLCIPANPVPPTAARTHPAVAMHGDLSIQPEMATHLPDSPPGDSLASPSAGFALADWSPDWTTLAARLRPWLPTLVIAWLVGMSLCSLRPLVGWFALHRLRSVGVSVVGPELEAAARRIAARLRMSQTVLVLRSTLASTPLVAGYLRPVLLIPVAMVAQLPLAELEAILAHELAHVRRHDFLVNLWQTSLETIFFYHPAVWSMSRQVRADRELCCDDIALSVIGDPVCYGRALLHVEELRSPEPLLALGAGGGELAARIQRLFGRPAPQRGVAGPIASVLLPSLMLAFVLSALAWGAPDGDEVKHPVSDGNKTAAAPARSLDIVIAEHSILWDARIRTWDEVVAELRDIRTAQGKPIHPNFYFTNGAHAVGHWDNYKAKAFEVYKELFEPAGVSLGGISPRAGPRYDVIRKAEDLVPDPKTLRSGVVVEKGQPKEGVLVVLVPEEGQMPVMLKPDLTLRDSLDEVWTVTGADGRFTIPVQPVHATDKLTEPPTYALAAISPTGYRLAKVPAAGAEATIELLPLANVELTPAGGAAQRIDLSLEGGLPDQSPGFSIYEIELADKVQSLALPPGKITISRSFEHADGGSRSYPAETVQMEPSERQKITLPNITEAEAERKWIEESIRPKAKAKPPGT